MILNRIDTNSPNDPNRIGRAVYEICLAQAVSELARGSLRRSEQFMDIGSQHLDYGSY